MTVSLNYPFKHFKLFNKNNFYKIILLLNSVIHNMKPAHLSFDSQHHAPPHRDFVTQTATGCYSATCAPHTHCIL